MKVLKLLFLLLLVKTSAIAQVKSLNQLILNAREPGPGIFVILNSGEKIVGSKIKLKDNYRWVSQYKLLLDDKEFIMKDVRYYQDNEAFNIYDKTIGIVPRAFRGRIEFYLFYAGGTLSDDRPTRLLYLNKDKGPLIYYCTTKNLLNLIEDQPDAVTLFHQKYKKVKNSYPKDDYFAKLVEVLSAYK